MAFKETQPTSSAAVAVRVAEDHVDGYSVRVTEWSDGRFSATIDEFVSGGIGMWQSFAAANMDEAINTALEIRETWLAGVAARAELKAQQTDALRVATTVEG